MGIGHSSESNAEADKTAIKPRRKGVPWLRSEEPMTESERDPARQEALDNQMVKFTARDYGQAAFSPITIKLKTQNMLK